MEQSFKILSKSSSGNPYTVTFYLEENVISASCSCPAGEHGKLCKHIVQMMTGIDSILYDINQKPILAKICSHLANTPISSLFSELNNKEMLLNKLQNEVKKTKKNIEKVILKK